MCKIIFNEFFLGPNFALSPRFMNLILYPVNNQTNLTSNMTSSIKVIPSNSKKQQRRGPCANLSHEAGALQALVLASYPGLSNIQGITPKKSLHVLTNHLR